MNRQPQPAPKLPALAVASAVLLSLAIAGCLVALAIVALMP